MTAIFYLFVVAVVATWIRHSLLAVPSSAPAPRPRKMRGTGIRAARATATAQRAGDNNERTLQR